MAKKKARKKAKKKAQKRARVYGDAKLLHVELKSLKPLVQVAARFNEFDHEHGLRDFHRVLNTADIKSREDPVMLIVKAARR